MCQIFLSDFNQILSFYGDFPEAPLSNNEAYMRFSRLIRARLKISVGIYYYVEGFTVLKDVRFNFLSLCKFLA